MSITMITSEKKVSALRSAQERKSHIDAEPQLWHDRFRKLREISVKWNIQSIYSRLSDTGDDAVD